MYHYFHMYCTFLYVSSHKTQHYYSDELHVHLTKNRSSNAQIASLLPGWSWQPQAYKLWYIVTGKTHTTLTKQASGWSGWHKIIKVMLLWLNNNIDSRTQYNKIEVTCLHNYCSQDNAENNAIHKWKQYLATRQLHAYRCGIAYEINIQRA